MCLLRENLVIADHGSTQPWRELPSPSAGLTYWPLLPAAGTTFTVSSSADTAGPAVSASPAADGSGYLSAAAQLAAADGQATPGVRVCEMGPEVREWTVRHSLLDSGPLALDFTVEVEEDGSARVRFGDNANGMQPGVGAELRVRQRVGGGAAGNVAAGSLRHVCTDDQRVAGMIQPVDACGGTDPESLASARQNAPEQFRLNQRAVLTSDYERLAMALPVRDKVVDAAAARASDGAAPLVTVHIHTGSWPGADASLLATVRLALEQCQPLGVDLQVRGAVPCPVFIDLEVTLEPGAAVAVVGQQIDNAIRRRAADTGAIRLRQVAVPQHGGGARGHSPRRGGRDVPAVRVQRRGLGAPPPRRRACRLALRSRRLALRSRRRACRSAWRSRRWTCRLFQAARRSKVLARFS